MGAGQSIYRETADGCPMWYGWTSAMHTRFDAILCGRGQEECEAAFRRMTEELNRLEKRLSRFDPVSDVWKINALAADEPVMLDGEMRDMLTAALEYGRKTEWFFDITAGSPARKVHPSQRVFLDPGTGEALFKTRGVQLDLGGYAKGYAVEVLKKELLEKGWRDFLLNFGNSSVYGGGSRPGGDGWRIGVEHPERPGFNVLEVTLRDNALNTSSNMPQHTEHIFLPVSDRYAKDTMAVSVVSESPLDGEVLSTAVFAAAADGRPVGFLRNFGKVSVYGIRYEGLFPVVSVLW